MTRGPALSRPRPGDDALAERLAQVLDPGGDVVVLGRKASGSGTFPKEVIRCRFRDGSERLVFCKYEAPRGDAHGHRGGIPYEADVYRHVLLPSRAPAPRFLGAYESSGEHWLFLEFLEDGERLSDRWREMGEAARWLGRFHAMHERPGKRDDLAFLIRYDEDYYLGWARRTSEYAGHWHRSVPWLAPLCERFADVVPVLLAEPQTVIHGEYTMHNVMLRGDVVHPTDWESAAIAAGEIDVMCLVDRWPEDTIQECLAAYARARWGDAVYAGHAARLQAAELYLHFRWLGEHPDLMVNKKRIWRFERLEALARELGVLR